MAMHPFRQARCFTRLLVSALLLPALPGCVSLKQQRLAPGEEPVLIGAAARDNRTPMDPAFACFSAELLAAQRRSVLIAVGDVRGFTGKYLVNEGTAITQGCALMDVRQQLRSHR